MPRLSQLWSVLFPHHLFQRIWHIKFWKNIDCHLTLTELFLRAVEGNEQNFCKDKTSPGSRSARCQQKGLLVLPVLNLCNFKVLGTCNEIPTLVCISAVTVSLHVRGGGNRSMFTKANLGFSKNASNYSFLTVSFFFKIQHFIAANVIWIMQRLQSKSTQLPSLYSKRKQVGLEGWEGKGKKASTWQFGAAIGAHQLKIKKSREVSCYIPF